MKLANQGKRWNIDDYVLLCNMWKTNMSLVDISIKLGRAPSSIINRLNIMHLLAFDRRFYTFNGIRCDQKIIITQGDLKLANKELNIRFDNEKQIQGNLQEVSQVGETTSRPD